MKDCEKMKERFRKRLAHMAEKYPEFNIAELYYDIFYHRVEFGDIARQNYILDDQIDFMLSVDRTGAVAKKILELDEFREDPNLFIHLHGQIVPDPNIGFDKESVKNMPFITDAQRERIIASFDDPNKLYGKEMKELYEKGIRIIDDPIRGNYRKLSETEGEAYAKYDDIMRNLNSMRNNLLIAVNEVDNKQFIDEFGNKYLPFNLSEEKFPLEMLDKFVEKAKNNENYVNIAFKDKDFKVKNLYVGSSKQIYDLAELI